MDQFATIFGIVVPLISVIMVFYIFLNTRKYAKLERKLSVKFYWFQEILLKQPIRELDMYFNRRLSETSNFINVLSTVSASNLVAEIASFLNVFNRDKRKVVDGYINHIMIINENLHSESEIELSNFQDEFQMEIDSLYRSNKLTTASSNKNLQSINFKYRRILYELLYRYHENIYNDL